MDQRVRRLSWARGNKTILDPLLLPERSNDTARKPELCEELSSMCREMLVINEA
jgi:hypothetical protein